MKEINKYALKIEPGDPIFQFGGLSGNQYNYGTVIRYDDRFETVAVVKSFRGDEVKVAAVQAKGARLEFAYGPTNLNLTYGVAETESNSNDNYNWHMGGN